MLLNLKSLYKLPDGVIHNPAKHLKWLKKERLALIKYSLEIYPKDIAKYFTDM